MGKRIIAVLLGVCFFAQTLVPVLPLSVTVYASAPQDTVSSSASIADSLQIDSVPSTPESDISSSAQESKPELSPVLPPESTPNSEESTLPPHSESTGDAPQQEEITSTPSSPPDETTQEKATGTQWVTVPGVEGGQLRIDFDTGTIVEAEKSIFVADIPAMVNGVEIVEIGFNAFEQGYLKTLRTSSITKIGGGAFFGCRGLSEVYLNEGLTKMESSVFSECISLRTITLPSTLQDYNTTPDADGFWSGTGAFTGSRLEEIVISKGTKTIPQNAFTKMRLLEKVIIQEGVISIGENAFSWCENLTEVNLPDGLKQIGRGAFKNSMQLTKMTLPKTLESYGDAFLHSGIEELTFAEGTTIIPDSATVCMSYLKKVNLPDSLETIGKQAFSIRSLTDIVLPKNLKTIQARAFSDSSIKTITIPATLTELHSDAFSGCGKLCSIDVDSNNPTYASLNGVLFSKNLDTLIFLPLFEKDSYVIPNGVKKIGAWSIGHKLEKIVFPESLEYIEETDLFSHQEGVLFHYYFNGDAPTLEVPPDFHPSYPPLIAIHHFPNKSGWTTPKWYGMETMPMELTTIKTIALPEPIICTVAAGNETLENILPKTVRASLSNDTTCDLPVAWDLTEFVPQKAGTYLLAGKVVVDTPEVLNPAHRMVTLVVSVCEQGDGTLITPPQEEPSNPKPIQPWDEMTLLQSGNDYVTSGTQKELNLQHLSQYVFRTSLTVDDGYHILFNDIKIENGGVLTIKKGAKISAHNVVVERGGTLRIEIGGQLSCDNLTACGGNSGWLFVSPQKGGEIFLSGTAAIKSDFSMKECGVFTVSSNGTCTVSGNVLFDTKGQCQLFEGKISFAENFTQKGDGKNFATSEKFVFQSTAQAEAQITLADNSIFQFGSLVVHSQSSHATENVYAKNVINYRTAYGQSLQTVDSAIQEKAEEGKKKFAKAIASNPSGITTPSQELKNAFNADEVKAVELIAAYAFETLCAIERNITKLETVIQSAVWNISFKLPDKNGKSCTVVLKIKDIGTSQAGLRVIELVVDKVNYGILGINTAVNESAFEKQLGTVLKGMTTDIFYNVFLSDIMDAAAPQVLTMAYTEMMRKTLDAGLTKALAPKAAQKTIEFIEKNLKITISNLSPFVATSADASEIVPSPRPMLLSLPKNTAANTNAMMIETDLDARLEVAIRKSLDLPAETALTEDFLSTITALNLSGCDLYSIQGIQNVKNLEILQMANNFITDVTPLSTLTNLKILDCASNNISDVSALQSLQQLQMLDVANNSITSLVALQGMTKLTTLSTQKNRISSVSPLKNMTSLARLDFSDNPITDATLNDLASLQDLQVLRADRCNLRSINGLSSPRLAYVSLASNQLEEIEALRNATVALKTLDISENQVAHLQPLQGATLLEMLSVEGNPIDDEAMQAVESCASMVALNASSTKLTTVQSILKLNALKILILNNVNIKDHLNLGVLTELTKLELRQTDLSNLEFANSMSQLIVLDVARNHIDQLTGIENAKALTTLDVSGNGIRDLTPIAQNNTLVTLVVGGNPIVPSLENEAFLKQLTEKGGQVNSETSYVKADCVVLADMITIESDGTQYVLRASVMPYNATDQNVVWKIDNEEVATVTHTGIVQGVSVGEAIITATIVGNPDRIDDDVSTQCVVKVQNTIGLLGDVNNSGTVNATDIVWVRQNILGNREFTAEQSQQADVNQSGTVNATDIIWLRQRILNLRNENFELIQSE